MKLDWIILANYVEAREGLVTIVGGAWDKIDVPQLQVQEPRPDQEQEPAAVMTGGVAIRLFASRSEAREHHEMRMSVRHLGGEVVHAIEGGFKVGTPPEGEMRELPELGVPIVIPINVAGLPLPSVGWYEVVFEVDGAEVGRSPFEVRRW